MPRLKGERIGVFATRSPHRPCPIGLTVAKVLLVFSLFIGCDECSNCRYLVFGNVSLIGKSSIASDFGNVDSET